MAARGRHIPLTAAPNPPNPGPPRPQGLTQSDPRSLTSYLALFPSPAQPHRPPHQAWPYLRTLALAVTPAWTTPLDPHGAPSLPSLRSLLNGTSERVSLTSLGKTTPCLILTPLPFYTSVNASIIVCTFPDLGAGRAFLFTSIFSLRSCQTLEPMHTHKRMNESMSDFSLDHSGFQGLKAPASHTNTRT